MNATEQIYINLPPSVRNTAKESDIVIIQSDKSTYWCKVFRFGGKYEEKFTVSRTPAGNVRKGSVRFYE